MDLMRLERKRIVLADFDNHFRRREHADYS